MRCLTGWLAAALLGAAVTAGAQRYEIDPYAGVFFPGKFAGVYQLNREGVYGVHGGVFLTSALEAEGHLGYINNLSLKDTLTRTRAYLWDADASYHFGKTRKKLYGTFGIGSVTTTVSNDARFLFDPDVLTTHRFLSLSYGGGLKALRRWGPIGYRVDVRGRTLPHYYGFRQDWVEATAGVTIAWGER